MIRTQSDIKNEINSILSVLVEMNLNSDDIDNLFNPIEIECFYNKIYKEYSDLKSISSQLKNRINQLKK